MKRQITTLFDVIIVKYVATRNILFAKRTSSTMDKCGLDSCFSTLLLIWEFLHIIYRNNMFFYVFALTVGPAKYRRWLCVLDDSVNTVVSGISTKFVMNKNYIDITFTWIATSDLYRSNQIHFDCLMYWRKFLTWKSNFRFSSIWVMRKCRFKLHSTTHMAQCAPDVYRRESTI